MKQLIQQAINKAELNHDEYNLFRFKCLLINLLHGNKLTHAEKHDVKMYL